MANKARKDSKGYALRTGETVMLQMVMGMTLISLFNIFVLVGFIATIWAEDWQAALGLVVLLVIEGVVITIGSIITAALTVIKDNLLSFCLGM